QSGLCLVWILTMIGGHGVHLSVRGRLVARRSWVLLLVSLRRGWLVAPSQCLLAFLLRVDRHALPDLLQVGAAFLRGLGELHVPLGCGLVVSRPGRWGLVVRMGDRGGCIRRGLVRATRRNW